MKDNLMASSSRFAIKEPVKILGGTDGVQILGGTDGVQTDKDTSVAGLKKLSNEEKQNCLASGRSELKVNKAKRSNKARLWITFPCPTSSLKSMGLFPVSSLSYLLRRQAERNKHI